MKKIRDIILERRIKKWEIEDKKVPQIYIDVFNDYLEEIANELSDYTKQVRKEVCERIRELADIDNWEEINGYTLGKILDQIERGGEDESTN